MESIKVLQVIVQNNRLCVEYEVTDGLKIFFSDCYEPFWVEYSEDISKVPTEIAIIPFVCNILPIIWLTDSKLILPCIDKTFYHSINEFKNGYVHMYPMLKFRGEVNVEVIKENSYKTIGGNAAFFSGGVDAFTTLICHRNEYPTLITLRGADVKIDDVEGWENVSAHLYNTVADFNLPDPVCITSNFRTFINESTLSQLVVRSNDGWWHGFQHGIGIISQAAPIAYIKHLGHIYIASSNTKEEICTCASDPTIDNYVKYGSTSIVHDQYEKNRQEKVRTIVEYCRAYDKAIDTRVCWLSRGGKNCCHCEKCIRTMFALMAEGESPKKYGFDFSDADLEISRQIVVETLYETNDAVRGNWKYTIERFKETKAYKNDSRINWIYEFNPYAKRPVPSLYQRARWKVGGILRKLGIR